MVATIDFGAVNMGISNLNYEAKLYIGTSGFSYKHWGNGIFYPPSLHPQDWLPYYATRFNSVEINNTFYRLPEKKVFENWYRKTPPDFMFSIKGNRFITHLKKLKVDLDSVSLFFDHASGLREKLGIVLWQLPENFMVNPDVLHDFCQLINHKGIGGKTKHAFEFRNSSWFNSQIYDILAKNNFSICIAHSGIWPCIETITADYVYFRFHGGQELVGSNYSAYELDYWAKRAKQYLGAGKDVYAYFNNDACGFAVQNAQKLRELILY